MSTHYKGTAEEVLALDTFIKFSRAVDSLQARIGSYQTNDDLSQTQFGVLEMLYHLGPVNQKTIGEKLLISKSNVVAVIDKLEAQELVQRQRSVKDRRQIFVHLTDNGRTLIETLFPAHVAAIVAEMDCLTDTELAELGRLCRKLGLKEEGPSSPEDGPSD